MSAPTSIDLILRDAGEVVQRELDALGVRLRNESARFYRQSAEKDSPELAAFLVRLSDTYANAADLTLRIAKTLHESAAASRVPPQETTP